MCLRERSRDGGSKRGGSASTFIDKPGLKLLTNRDLATASRIVFTPKCLSGTHLPIRYSKTP